MTAPKRSTSSTTTVTSDEHQPSRCPLCRGPKNNVTVSRPIVVSRSRDGRPIAISEQMHYDAVWLRGCFTSTPTGQVTVLQNSIPDARTWSGHPPEISLMAQHLLPALIPRASSTPIAYLARSQFVLRLPMPRHRFARRLDVSAAIGDPVQYRHGQQGPHSSLSLIHI